MEHEMHLNIISLYLFAIRAQRQHTICIPLSSNSPAVDQEPCSEARPDNKAEEAHTAFTRPEPRRHTGRLEKVAEVATPPAADEPLESDSHDLEAEAPELEDTHEEEEGYAETVYEKAEVVAAIEAWLAKISSGDCLPWPEGEGEERCWL